MEKINPGNHGGTVDYGGFTVSSSTRCIRRAGTSRRVRRPLGNPLGLIVTAPGEPTLYHMGDTGIFGDMALINELYQPEIGLVPIGDRFTMGTPFAGKAMGACKRFFKFRRIVPIHYATFPILGTGAASSRLPKWARRPAKCWCLKRGKQSSFDTRRRRVERLRAALYSQPSGATLEVRCPSISRQ